MCFFCAYFISGGTLTDIPLLKHMAEKDKYVLEMICQIIEAALEK